MFNRRVVHFIETSGDAGGFPTGNQRERWLKDTMDSCLVNPLNTMGYNGKTELEELNALAVGSDLVIPVVIVDVKIVVNIHKTNASNQHEEGHG